MQVSLLQFLVILFVVLFLGMLAVNRWAPKNPWLRALVGLPAGEPEGKPAGNVRIVMTGHCRGKVYVDDHLVERVRSFEMSASADNELNRLTLVLNPEQIDVQGEFDVTEINNDGSRQYVVGEPADPSEMRGPRLGWDGPRIPFSQAFSETKGG